MFTHKKLYEFLRVGILLPFCLGALSKVFADEDLVPKSNLDYGSGYTIGICDYYAGGIPSIGLWVGHPNLHARKDRALVRFDISTYIPRAIPVASAKLYFKVGSFTGREDAYEIEVTHLAYDASVLSSTDLVNSNVERVGSIVVKREAYNDEAYSIDATRYVNDDIAKGNLYSAFRFRNVSTEKKGNPDLSPVGITLGSLGKPLLHLEIKREQSKMVSSSESVIVEQGKPNAAIIVSDGAPDSVRLAGSELQDYVEKVTGARLPIQTELIPQGMPGINIFLGESSFTKAHGLNLEGLESDGFKIVAQDNWLAILGRDYPGEPIIGMFSLWRYDKVYSPKFKIGVFGETGTLFGVYRFLEDACGIRWYLPGELGTVIPKMETIKVVPINYQKSPDFEYRYPWFCNFDQSDEDALWYRRTGFGAASPVQISHSFYFFQKYKETHPEYFALIDGQRDFSDLSTIGGGGNLCLSNPDVVKQWVADITDYFDKNPQQSTFPVMPSDGMLKICECPECQKQIDRSAESGGKFSNYVWSFVNQVAKEVYKTHPDKFIGCTAYDSYREPPTNIKKLNPNVAVMICKMRGGYIDNQYCEEMTQSILAWREKVNDLYSWEYYRYSVRPWIGFPVVYPHIIADDLRFLKEIKAKGEFIESESWESGESNVIINYPGMQHINLYVTAKLLWDSSLDVDKLMNEYYETFYGPSSEEMKGFWTTAEEIWMTAYPKDENKRDNWANPINIYTRDKLDQLTFFLEEARLKAPENSIYRKRVELISSEFLPARRKLSNVLVVNPPQLTIAGPTSEIQIDGVLEDSVWTETTPMVFVDQDGEAAQHKTVAYTAWDKDNLYVAFINFGPRIPYLTSLATEQGQSWVSGRWDDESVEILIAPNPDERAKCYQFSVNAKGIICGDVHNPSSSVDEKWKCVSSAKTKIEATRWVAEVKIPFMNIGINPPVEGKTIAVNLYRNRDSGQPVVYSCWSPTLGFSRFSPAQFGQLTFKGE